MISSRMLTRMIVIVTMHEKSMTAAGAALLGSMQDAGGQEAGRPQRSRAARRIAACSALPGRIHACIRYAYTRLRSAALHCMMSVMQQMLCSSRRARAEPRTYSSAVVQWWCHWLSIEPRPCAGLQQQRRRRQGRGVLLIRREPVLLVVVLNPRVARPPSPRRVEE
jgi:hypothetical protein